MAAAMPQKIRAGSRGICKLVSHWGRSGIMFSFWVGVRVRKAEMYAPTAIKAAWPMEKHAGKAVDQIQAGRQEYVDGEGADNSGVVGSLIAGHHYNDDGKQ